MGPHFSPRVPLIKSVRAALAARSGPFRPEISLARWIVKSAPVLFLLCPALVLSTTVLVAQTPERVQFQAQTISTINKWYFVLIAIATFLIQAFLIVWLFTSQSRRRQAEIESRRLASVAESERQHLAEVVSNVPGIVWEARLDPVTHERRTTYISNYVERMLGYTVDEWMNTPSIAINIVHEEDREKVKRAAEAVFAGAGPALLQFRWVAKDGRIVWVEAHIAPLLDDTRKIIGIRGVTLDVTERRLVEEAGRQSEERFAKAFRANPQPMSLTTLADGRYVYVNDSFLAMSGYTRDELIGHTSLELQVWQTPGHRAHFMECLKKQASLVNIETQFRTKGGSMRVLLSSAEQLDLSGEKCVLMASSDITERVAVQQALRESEERFRNMADSAPVMIWISGQDKECTYVNKQWLDFTGRMIDEQLGDGWLQSLHPGDYKRSVDTYTNAFDDRKSFEMEYRLRRYDGEYRWIFDAGAPRLSPDGEFLGYIGTCLDITE